MCKTPVKRWNGGVLSPHPYKCGMDFQFHLCNHTFAMFYMKVLLKFAMCIPEFLYKFCHVIYKTWQISEIVTTRPWQNCIGHNAMLGYFFLNHGKI